METKHESVNKIELAQGYNIYIKVSNNMQH